MIFRFYWEYCISVPLKQNIVSDQGKRGGSYGRGYLSWSISTDTSQPLKLDLCKLRVSYYSRINYTCEKKEHVPYLYSRVKCQKEHWLQGEKKTKTPQVLHYCEEKSIRMYINVYINHRLEWRFRKGCCHWYGTIKIHKGARLCYKMNIRSGRKEW